METKFYTPQEVAEILRLNTNTIYEYIRMGKLRAARFGNRYRITQPDIDTFIEHMKAFSQLDIEANQEDEQQ